uniref:Uncharacterized protein n=1 Tax=Myoviridae sp. ctsK93 TaxID=2825190 RepID=A0A8S5PIW6_9CAUD|nr:MAG TPA: hypothetical protein [Myoviridae sp. ctsK93]
MQQISRYFQYMNERKPINITQKRKGILQYSSISSKSETCCIQVYSITSCGLHR